MRAPVAEDLELATPRPVAPGSPQPHGPLHQYCPALCLAAGDPALPGRDTRDGPSPGSCGPTIEFNVTVALPASHPP
jgi:hypothetical protein